MLFFYKNPFRFLFLTGLFLWVSSTNLQAQYTFSGYSPVKAKHVSKLYVHFEGSTFFKNNEYFSRFAYGYTGLGFFAKPALSYTFSKRLRISGGIYLLKFSGRKGFHQSIPFFTVQYRLSPSLEMVMGNLYGTSFHQLEEPLFRLDNYYRHHMESGLQFLFHHKHFRSDLWLNWENFIWFGDNTQEQLTVGSSSRLLLYKQGKLSISVPIQILAKHKGGQLAPGPHPTLTTVINGLSGLNIKFKFNKLTNLQFSQHMAFYKSLSHPAYGEAGYLPFDAGWGSYTTLGMQWKHFNFRASYWYGHQFIAPLGETQFQSISEIDPTYIRENRQLFTPRMTYSRQIAKGVRLQTGAYGYYDFLTHQFDYAYELYIHIKSDFFLKKVTTK